MQSLKRPAPMHGCLWPKLVHASGAPAKEQVRSKGQLNALRGHCFGVGQSTCRVAGSGFRFACLGLGPDSLRHLAAPACIADQAIQADMRRVTTSKNTAARHSNELGSCCQVQGRQHSMNETPQYFKHFHFRLPLSLTGFGVSVCFSMVFAVDRLKTTH